MRAKTLLNTAGVLVTAAVFSLLTWGDEWIPARPKTYCSDNKRFCVLVRPRELRSNLAYFEDKVQGKEPAGQRPGTKPKATATLFEQTSSNGNVERWTTDLTNDVAPVDVVVSNDGRFAVALDNWHAMGYGDDVVAIYDWRGKLVRKYSLEQLLNQNVGRVTQSVSSRWWREQARIENSILIITVKLRKALESQESATVREEDSTEWRELRINLESAEIVSDKPTSPPARRTYP